MSCSVRSSSIDDVLQHIAWSRVHRSAHTTNDPFFFCLFWNILLWQRKPSVWWIIGPWEGMNPTAWRHVTGSQISKFKMDRGERPQIDVRDMDLLLNRAERWQKPAYRPFLPRLKIRLRAVTAVKRFPAPARRAVYFAPTGLHFQQLPLASTALIDRKTDSQTERLQGRRVNRNKAKKKKKKLFKCLTTSKLIMLISASPGEDAATYSFSHDVKFAVGRMFHIRWNCFHYQPRVDLVSSFSSISSFYFNNIVAVRFCVAEYSSRTLKKRGLKEVAGYPKISFHSLKLGARLSSNMLKEYRKKESPNNISKQ